MNHVTKSNDLLYFQEREQRKTTKEFAKTLV